MKTLTKSLVVAALAASAVSSNAAIVTFNGTLTANSLPSGSPTYTGGYSGSYNTATGVLKVDGNASVAQTSVTAGVVNAITTGTVTAAGGFSQNLSIAGSPVSSNPQSLPVPGFGVFNFFLTSQTYTASSLGQGPAANLSGPVTYTISLKASGTEVLNSTFTVVPEPEVYAGVAALGLAGFALWRRRNA